MIIGIKYTANLLNRKVHLPIKSKSQSVVSKFCFTGKPHRGRGRTLKNEPAEVRGSGTGWREENSALCSHRFALQAIARCTRYTATVGAAPTCLCSLPGERIIFIRGPNFEMLPAAHRTLGSTQPWRAKLSKMNPLRCGAPARGGAKRIRLSAPIASRFRPSLVVLDTLRRSVQLPTCLCSLPGERIIFIRG